MIQESIKKQVEESILTKHLLIESGLSHIEEAAGLLIDAVNTSKKILWCGNGGSAADAQHLATELMGGMSDHDRKPIPSIALTLPRTLHSLLLGQMILTLIQFSLDKFKV